MELAKPSQSRVAAAHVAAARVAAARVAAVHQWRVLHAARCERRAAWELAAAGSAGRGGRVATVAQWCDASIAADAARGWLATGQLTTS